MVDKGSLRSNKRSNSNSKDKDTKEASSSKKPASAAKPTRNSSRRSKKAEEGSSQEAEGGENGAEDVEMKDDSSSTVEMASQAPFQKVNDGGMDMDVDESMSIKGDKTEPAEDPVLTVVNGIGFIPLISS